MAVAKKSPRVSKRVKEMMREPTSHNIIDESSKDYDAEAENMRPPNSPRGRMNWSNQSQIDSETVRISTKTRINREGMSKQSKKETNGESRTANHRSKTGVATNPSAHGSKNGRAKKVAKQSPRVSKRIQEMRREPTFNNIMDESSRNYDAEAENMRPPSPRRPYAPQGVYRKRMNWSNQSPQDPKSTGKNENEKLPLSLLFEYHVTLENSSCEIKLVHATSYRRDKSPETSKERVDVLTEKTKSLNKFVGDSYVEDTTLSGADPFSQNCPHVNKRKDENEKREEQLLKLNIPQKKIIFEQMKAYVKDSPDWCEWTSMTLSEDLDLFVIAVPPCNLVQVFLIGVNLHPILLTCYEDQYLAAEVRKYANDTASALKWRLLDFCHLDFLLLPCIVLKNFDSETLMTEIMTQLEDQSECYGGPTCLDEDMFQTMKAATTALAGSTIVPSIFENSSSSKIKTLVMEKDWRDVMSLLIEECSERKEGVPFKFCLEPEDATFKVKVAVVETMKRWSVKNHVTFLTSTAGPPLDTCFKRLREEMNEAYGVVLNIAQSSTTAEVDIDGNQTRDSETVIICPKARVNREGISKQSKKETNGESSSKTRAQTSDYHTDESSLGSETEAETMRPPISPRGGMNRLNRSRPYNPEGKERRKCLKYGQVKASQQRNQRYPNVVQLGLDAPCLRSSQ